MNEEQLQAIEERANKATPGPWHCYYSLSVGATVQQGPGKPWIFRAQEGATRADLDFVAAAREDVPALIAEVRSLRAKLDAVPVTAINQLAMDSIDDAWSRKSLRAVRAWLKTQEPHP